MKTGSLFAAAITGAFFATTLILACGNDDSPTDARGDAGTCTCPASEPPLAGRIVRVAEALSIAPGAFAGGAALCPSGGSLLGGGCKLADSVSDPQFHLINAGTNSDGTGFRCTWQNNNSVARDGVAEAFCLVPPQ